MLSHPVIYVELAACMSCHDKIKRKGVRRIKRKELRLRLRFKKEEVPTHGQGDYKLCKIHIMGLNDLQWKLKRLRVKCLKGNVESNKRKDEEKCLWKTPISHGFHVIEDKSLRSGSGYLGSDSVVVQREQIQDEEVWLFGVFDAQTGDGVTRYLKSHLFDKKLNEIRRKSKEAMKKAYISAGTKLREGEEENQGSIKKGSASAIVINREKVVAAYIADYRAIICRDGVAKQIGKRQRCRAKKHWPLYLIAGAWHMPKVRIIGCKTGKTGSKPSTSEPVVWAEKIDSDAEFLILASNGIWEVMNNQEAVNLVRHMDDPQEAAECLTKEALTRISRSNISCLVIRFD
ncbi:hypothetical protein NE237_005242 [Protea cynaroides]|uniref:PPM-type phosphatase domain-containing protein n=1 Tax=Protea cynaroides TaxID=273540 RepID=A0A9Q0KK68_9MAGN|nr:hypothetical protein NE237_005242 [Protea cynaroides]